MFTIGKEHNLSSDQKESDYSNQEAQYYQQHQQLSEEPRESNISSKSQSKEYSRASEERKPMRPEEKSSNQQSASKEKAGKAEQIEAMFNRAPNQPKKNYVSRSFEQDARGGYEYEEEDDEQEHVPNQGEMYYQDQDEEGGMEMGYDDEENFEMANIDREIDKQDRLYLSLKAQAEAEARQHEGGHKHSEIEEKDEIDYYEKDPINYNRIMENLDEVPGHDQEYQEEDVEQYEDGQDGGEYEVQEGYEEDPNDQHGILVL